MNLQKVQIGQIYRENLKMHDHIPSYMFENLSRINNNFIHYFFNFLYPSPPKFPLLPSSKFMTYVSLIVVACMYV